MREREEKRITTCRPLDFTLALVSPFLVLQRFFFFLVFIPCKCKSERGWVFSHTTKHEVEVFFIFGFTSSSFPFSFASDAATLKMRRLAPSPHHAAASPSSSSLPSAPGAAGAAATRCRRVVRSMLQVRFVVLVSKREGDEDSRESAGQEKRRIANFSSPPPLLTLNPQSANSRRLDRSVSLPSKRKE
jgi:hypothetical protein